MICMGTLPITLAFRNVSFCQLDLQLPQQERYSSSHLDVDFCNQLAERL